MPTLRRLLPIAALGAAIAATLAGWLHEATRLLPADPSAPLVYVALGDSTVEGVGASSPRANYVTRIQDRLRALYPAARAFNLGVAGATSGDVVAGELDRAIALAPDLVTLSVGPNDLTDGVPVATFASHVTTALAMLRARTSAVVVVSLLPDLAVTPRFAHSPDRQAVAREALRFNEALARVARRARADVVDLHGPSRREVPAHPELIAADGYHPSDAGYARWSSLMWADIVRHVPRAVVRGSG